MSENMRHDFGHAAELAEALWGSSELAASVARRFLEGLSNGKPGPRSQRLPDTELMHDGRRFRVIVLLYECPPWFLEIDPDIELRCFSARTVGPSGHEVIGSGDSKEEALAALRIGLDRDARLLPRGEG